MDTFIDVRQLVLNGEVKPLREAIYLPRLGGWFNIVELYGDERSDVMQNAMNMTTGKLNLKALYAGLAVMSLTYPHPDAKPSEPVAPEPPPDFSPDEDFVKYQEDLKKYYKALADFQNPYPMNHPKAGERVFQPTDRAAFGKIIPGGIQEEIGAPAFRLSGFSQADLEEEKKDSTRTINSTSSMLLPSGSGE